MASSSASSSADVDRFKFKVAHVMHVQDVASLLALKKILKSPPLTCPDDPQATSIRVEICFGSEAENFLSAYFAPSNATIRWGIANLIIYDEEYNKIYCEVFHGDDLAEEERLILFSLENVGHVNWTIICEQYYDYGHPLDAKAGAGAGAGASGFSADILSLLDNPEDSDFKFIVENDGRIEVIPAHKNILVARSDYFRALFKSGMKESLAKEIKVEEDPALVKELLKFIYSGLPPKHLDAVAIGLLPLADKYQVNDLKKLCISALYRIVWEKNVVDIILLAEKLHLPALQRYCIPVFQDDMKGLENLEKLKENPDLLLKLLLLCNK